MNVTKKEFVRQLMDKHHYKKSSAVQLVDDFWDVLNDNIEAGNPVSFYGYGCFDLIQRKARLGVNPCTQERCTIPEHWSVRFFPGNIIKRSAKKWADNQERGLV